MIDGRAYPRAVRSLIRWPAVVLGLAFFGLTVAMGLDQYRPTLAAFAAYPGSMGDYAVVGLLASIGLGALVNGAIVSMLALLVLWSWRRHRLGRAQESRPPSGDGRPAGSGWR